MQTPAGQHTATPDAHNGPLSHEHDPGRPPGAETTPQAATRAASEAHEATETEADPGADQPCPFCEIVAGRAHADFVQVWDDAIAIVPHNPVAPGHTLVIPRDHVRDFGTDPDVSAIAMYRAAELVQGPQAMNLITSRGREATQSVFHLHLHLVPRAENDGLALPWYSGRSRTTRKLRSSVDVLADAFRPVPPGLAAGIGRAADVAAPAAESEISVRGWTA